MGRLLLAIVVLGGCLRTSEKYCKLHAEEDPVNCPLGGDCTSDLDCMNGRCDPEGHTCVACLTSLDCDDELKPICDLDTKSCAGCVADSDCEAQVCLADGRCPAASSVLYVAANAATGHTCAIDDRCTLDEAVALLDAAHTTISLAPGDYVQMTGVVLPALSARYRLVGPHVVGAPTATITATSSRSVLQIPNGADVEVDSLELRNGNHGITFDGGTLVARRLYIHDNVSSGLSAIMNHSQIALVESVVALNKRNGLSIDDASLDVTNNYFVQNGSTQTQDIAGVRLNAVDGKLEFNTIAGNIQSMSSQDAPGIHCNGMIELASNLVVENRRGTTPAAVQTTTTNNCRLGTGPAATYKASDIDEAMMFENTTPTWTGYRLKSTAPAEVLNVMGFTCIGDDFDRETRPMGGACDLGADELTQ